MLSKLIERLKRRLSRDADRRIDADAVRRHELVQDDNAKAAEVENLRRDLIRLRTEQHGR